MKPLYFRMQYLLVFVACSLIGQGRSTVLHISPPQWCEELHLWRQTLQSPTIPRMIIDAGLLYETGNKGTPSHTLRLVFTSVLLLGPYFPNIICVEAPFGTLRNSKQSLL
jgi:hypothetical protein